MPLPGAAAPRLRRWALLAASGALSGHFHVRAMGRTVDEGTLTRRWTMISGPIGLGANASLEITLRTARPSPDAYVMLLSEFQWRQLLASAAGHWAPRGWQPYPPCTWRASLADAVNTSFPVSAGGSGRYFLGVLQQGRLGEVEGLKGEVAFLNHGAGGPSQLEVQDRHAPTTVFVAAWAFLVSALALAAAIALRARGRSWLHGLLLLTLVAKCGVMLLVRLDLRIKAATGRESVQLKFVRHVLGEVQIICQVLVFYMVGLGWKVTRSHLRYSEWLFAGVVSGLSFMFGMTQVICNTLGVCGGGQSYLLTQFTLHSLCYLVVIIATNFNIFSLQRQISEALAAPETSSLYAKHRAYSFFRGFFLYFVILPTMTNFLALHVFPWDERWVVTFVHEASLWAIYTAVAWLFRPGLCHLRVFQLAVVDSDSGTNSDE